MNTQQLRVLAEKCEAMFPSPWKAVGKENWRLIGFPQVEYSNDKGSYIPVHNDTDAAYIAAANPAYIIALLDRLEAAERVCHDVKRFLSWEEDGDYAGRKSCMESDLAAWQQSKEGK